MFLSLLLFCSDLCYRQRRASATTRLCCDRAAAAALSSSISSLWTAFNHVGRIYSSKVNSQLVFFLFFFLSFCFWRPVQYPVTTSGVPVPVIHLSRLGCNFVALVLAVSAMISVKEAFRGKTAKTCGCGRRRRGGWWEGPPLLKATPRGLITALLSITTHNSRQQPIFETSVAVIQMQLSHWQPLANSTGPKL